MLPPSIELSTAVIVSVLTIDVLSSTMEVDLHSIFVALAPFCSVETLEGFQLSSHSKSFAASSERVMQMEPVKSRPSTDDGGISGVCASPRRWELIAVTAVGEIEMRFEAIGDKNAN